MNRTERIDRIAAIESRIAALSGDAARLRDIGLIKRLQRA